MVSQEGQPHLLRGACLEDALLLQTSYKGVPRWVRPRAFDEDTGNPDATLALTTFGGAAASTQSLLRGACLKALCIESRCALALGTSNTKQPHVTNDAQAAQARSIR